METEEPLLEENRECTWGMFAGELNQVSSLALPMIVVTLSQHLLRVVVMMMFGHLGELELSGASIATSFTNVTGFSFIFGISGALETLCGQGYSNFTDFSCMFNLEFTFLYGQLDNYFLALSASSTHVSNELGAGKPRAARVAVFAFLVLSVSEFVIASTILFFCHYILGRAFSNEMGVVYLPKT